MSIWSWDMFFQYLFNRYMFMGVLTTIWLTIAAMFFGIILGLIAALCLLSKNRVVRFLGQVYTWVWRGSPLLVQILIIYTVLPLYRVKMDVVTSAIVALSMNEGAYLAEIIRGGITSIRKGQFEAAKGTGYDLSDNDAVNHPSSGDAFNCTGSWQPHYRYDQGNIHGVGYWNGGTSAPFHPPYPGKFCHFGDLRHRHNVLSYSDNGLGNSPEEN